MTILLLFLFLLPIISSAKEEVYLLPPSQTQQANKFYYECFGADWKNNNGWPLEQTSFSSTFSPHGISFELSDEIVAETADTIIFWARVLGIDLNNNNLSGDIPKIDLPELELLDLSYNNLSGAIPNLELPKLKELNLIINYLSGPLPNFSLPKLERLILGGNNIDGEIPDFSFPNLVSLSLRDNLLSGEIPNFDFPHLENLNLRNNKLRGSIPNFNLPKLQILRLQTNFLSGEIPDFDFPEIGQMYLSENNLSGSVPDFDLPKLDAIYLDNNRLSGTLPNFNLGKLRWAYFYNNKLSGEIPNFDLPLLEALNFQNNLLSGNIPDFDFPKLTDLDVSINKFTFSPLETNLDKYKNYIYKNQDTVLPLVYSDGIFEVSVDGTENIYTWLRDSLQIEINEDGKLSQSVEGAYQCLVTSSLLPDLVLKSREYELDYESLENLGEEVLITYEQKSSLLRINAPKDKTGRIAIYSLEGNIVLAQNMSSKAVMVNNLATGVYFISIEGGGNHRVQKIIIY